MANSISTFSTAMILYGSELLAQLQANLFLAKTVSKRYAPPAHRGGIVYVPNMSDPAAQVHTADGSAITPSDVSVAAIPVTLTDYATAMYHFDSIDMVMTNIDFRSAAAKRGAYVLASAVEAKLAGLWNQIPAFYGDPTTSLFDDAILTKITNGLKILDDNNAPIMDQRFCAVSSGSKLAALQNDAFTKYVQAGEASQTPLMKGQMGERLGVQFGLSQLIVKSTGGGTDWAGTVLVNNGGGYAIGAASIALDGFSAASPAIKKGDSFLLKGNFYQVTADVTGSGNAATVAIDPPLKTVVADDDPISVSSGGSGSDDSGVTGAYQNLLYLADAFALAVAPIEDENRPGTETQIVSDDQTGLSIRVTHSYVHAGTSAIGAFQHLFSAELLYGVKLVRKEFAVRLPSST